MGSRTKSIEAKGRAGAWCWGQGQDARLGVLQGTFVGWSGRKMGGEESSQEGGAKTTRNLMGSKQKDPPKIPLCIPCALCELAHSDDP